MAKGKYVHPRISVAKRIAWSSALKEFLLTIELIASSIGIQDTWDEQSSL